MHNYIQRFPFSFKHKSRQLNKVADALSRWAIFLNSIKSEIMGFEYLKDLEANDEDFQEERKNYTSRAPCKYQICDEFLFFTDRLCIPEGPLRERIIWKSYNRGLRGHMSQDKSIALVEAWYNWLHLKRDVEKFIKHRYTCQNAKGHAQNTGLYSLLPIPEAFQDGLSIDFMLGLPRTQWGTYSFFMIVDWFSKTAHCISYNKTYDTKNITQLLFLEVVHLHRLSKTSVSDQDSKFLNYF